MKLSVFTLVPHKPHHHLSVFKQVEDDLLATHFYYRPNASSHVLSCVVGICDSEENWNHPVVFATGLPMIIQLENAGWGNKLSVATLKKDKTGNLKTLFDLLSGIFMDQTIN